MSLYCQIETAMKNQEALIFALMETGLWQREQIEIYDEPQHLFGYRGDLRQDKANIIIRRKNVGMSSNDLGFIKNEDNTYTAIISEFDKTKYSEHWTNKLKQNYAFQAIRLQQEKKGRQVSRTKLPDGKQRVTIHGYR
jgi:hypothetical protein